jgi:hypothetical protein
MPRPETDPDAPPQTVVLGNASVTVAPFAAAPGTVTTVTASVEKPFLKQATTYLGGAAFASAGWVVSHGPLIAAVCPPPWNAVATGALSLLGAVLIAYKEKSKSVSIVTETPK